VFNFFSGITKTEPNEANAGEPEQRSESRRECGKTKKTVFLFYFTFYKNLLHFNNKVIHVHIGQIPVFDDNFVLKMR
jgi:hypothetical protein